MTGSIDFLLIAAPKSGTTWVQRMLSEHPQAHCAETRLFGRYFDPRVGESLHMPLEQFVGFMSGYYRPPCAQDQHDAYFQSLLSKLIGTIAAHARSESGKPIYGEKLTPYAGTAQHVLDQVRGLGRETRVIHLVRDCRDVIVSGMAHWRRALESTGNTVDTEMLFARMLDLWVETESAMEHSRAHFEQLLEVRYEDLLTDPTAQAERVLAFIGADRDPELIARCVENTHFAALSGGRQPGQEDPSSFYRCGTAGQWKQRLTPGQLARVHDQAGGLLSARGYEPSVQAGPVS